MEIIIPATVFAVLLSALIAGTVLLATTDLIVILTIASYVSSGVVIISMIMSMKMKKKMDDDNKGSKWFTLFVSSAMAFIVIMFWSLGASEVGPSREEVLEKGDRKEVAIRYIEPIQYNSVPTVYMEDGRYVEIDMNKDNVVISGDGKDRAIAYDMDLVLPWG